MPPQAVESDFKAGELVGGALRIEAMLAHGGAGVVYRVRDERTGRQLALKQLRRPNDDCGALVASQFEREYHTLLAHPCIIEVHDYGFERGSAYYTMELLDGEDLHERGRLPWRQACALLRDVASSLAILHSRGLVHRDVSVRNVRCTSDGRAKLFDFGAMAPIGVVHRAIGTPPFAPPEALQLQALDGRADLYGLGALAYWTLTGRYAYPAQTFNQLRDLWRNPPASPSKYDPDVPEALAQLVLRLLQLDRAERPSKPGSRGNAWRVRMLYKLARGDLGGARECQRRAELLDLQDTASIAMPGGMVRAELLAYINNDDLIGVKGVVARMEELAAVRPRWQSTLALARASYKRLQGKLDDALETLQPALATLRPRSHIDWPLIVKLQLTLMLEQGRVDEVTALGRELVALCASRGLADEIDFICPPIAAALVKAGDAGRAAQLLDTAFAHWVHRGWHGVGLAAEPNHAEPNHHGGDRSTARGRRPHRGALPCLRGAGAGWGGCCLSRGPLSQD